MLEWPVMVGAVTATALLVRLDSRMFGPYFALSDLLPGAGGELFVDLVRSGDTRRSVVRRLAYPFLLGGFFRAVFDLPVWEVAAAGGLTCGLLLWPLIFGGLPKGVATSDWQLPVLYGSYGGLYVGMAVAGAYSWDWLQATVDGEFWSWVGDQVLPILVVALFLLFARTIFKRVALPYWEKIEKRVAALEQDD